MCKVKIKPVYNFQSVEIEFDAVDFEEATKIVAENYSAILGALIDATDEVIAPNVQTQKGQKQIAKVKEELATEKQKAIMRKFDIDFDEDITKREAGILIQKSYEKSINDLE